MSKPSSLVLLVALLGAGAALADDDVSCDNALATVNLDAKPFTVRFATVLGRRLPFFVSHVLLLRLDRGHADAINSSVS